MLLIVFLFQALALLALSSTINSKQFFNAPVDAITLISQERDLITLTPTCPEFKFGQPFNEVEEDCLLTNPSTKSCEIPGADGPTTSCAVITIGKNQVLRIRGKKGTQHPKLDRGCPSSCQSPSTYTRASTCAYRHFSVEDNGILILSNLEISGACSSAYGTSGGDTGLTTYCPWGGGGGNRDCTDTDTPVCGLNYRGAAILINLYGVGGGGVAIIKDVVFSGNYAPGLSSFDRGGSDPYCDGSIGGGDIFANLEGDVQGTVYLLNVTFNF